MKIFSTEEVPKEQEKYVEFNVKLSFKIPISQLSFWTFPDAKDSEEKHFKGRTPIALKNHLQEMADHEGATLGDILKRYTSEYLEEDSLEDFEVDIEIC